MSSFVLVHGAWNGAHGFRHVRRRLSAAGHEVFTPALTGLGARVHLASPQVTLSTHIQDVVNLVIYEDLRDIVLLGFSYGGMVVTGALEHIADRIRHLIYLDAFVPKDGDSAMNLAMGRAPLPISLGEEWLIQTPARELDDPEETRWMAARRAAQPLGTFKERVRLFQALEDFPFSRTYIKATRSPETDIGEPLFRQAAAHARAHPEHWRYLEIDSTHLIAVNQPEALSQLLLDIAAS